MLLCQIYRSPRKQEMYLYVEKDRGTEHLPEELLMSFGEPEAVMILPLTSERKLARANTQQVLDSIRTQGYYLQMPPTLADMLAREVNREV